MTRIGEEQEVHEGVPEPVPHPEEDGNPDERTLPEEWETAPERVPVPQRERQAT